MACTCTPIIEDLDCRDFCPGEAPKLIQSKAFTLDQITGFSQSRGFAKISFSKEPVTVLWVPGSARFFQSAKWMEKVEQTFIGDILVENEDTREAIVGMDYVCNLCLIHEVDNGIKLLQGTHNGEHKPYYKNVSVRVEPFNWRTKKLPFTATFTASCVDNTFALLTQDTE